MQLPPFEKLAMPSPRAIAPTAMTEGWRAGLSLQASAAQRIAFEPREPLCEMFNFEPELSSGAYCCSCLYWRGWSCTQGKSVHCNHRSALCMFAELSHASMTKAPMPVEGRRS